MKVKIIYISGGDKFNVSDVRMAFEEVRTALNLDSDTVMFGIPVDTDDTLDNKFQDVQSIECHIPNTDVVEPIAEQPGPESTPEPEPVKEVKKRGRKKIVPQEAIEPESEPVVDTDDASQEKVIPILSVLETKSTENTEPDTDSTQEESTVIVSQTVDEDNGVITEADTIIVQEVITNDVPNTEPEKENIEKTLEELLESMKPLQEDSENDDTDYEDNSPEADIQEPVTDTVEPDMEDLTLQQLATEFMENQDKIVNTTKPSVRGKIGKLKNILPFKKQKHEDSGLMGDLFGWAGVAANDEDFSMPGFFTGATKK